MNPKKINCKNQSINVLWKPDSWWKLKVYISFISDHCSTPISTTHCQLQSLSSTFEKLIPFMDINDGQWSLFITVKPGCYSELLTLKGCDNYLWITKNCIIKDWCYNDFCEMFVRCELCLMKIGFQCIKML